MWDAAAYFSLMFSGKAAQIGIKKRVLRIGTDKVSGC